MTQQKEIQEFNKRCAELMGWYKILNTQPYIEINSENEIEWLTQYRNYRTYNGKYQFSLELCKFHSDWNWIMEVVEKIELLYDPFNFEIASGNILIKTPCYCTNTFEGKTKKEAVVEAINQFLIFYYTKLK